MIPVGAGPMALPPIHTVATLPAWALPSFEGYVPPNPPLPLGLERAREAMGGAAPVGYNVFARYPGIRPEYRPWLLGTDPRPAQLPRGTLAIWRRPPGAVWYSPDLDPMTQRRTMVHEWGHAMTIPPREVPFGPFPTARIGPEWEEYLRDWLATDDPVYGRLQDVMRPMYRARGPIETYADLAAAAGANLLNMPATLRPFYPWLRVTPGSHMPHPEPPVVPYLPSTPEGERLAWALLRTNMTRWPGAVGWAERPIFADAARLVQQVYPEYMQRYGQWPDWLRAAMATPLHYPEGS